MTFCRKAIRALLAGLALALAFIGSADAQSGEAPAADPLAQIITDTIAGPALTTLRIGVLGGDGGAERVAAQDCLARRLEQVLELPVEIAEQPDYAATLRGLLSGAIDFAELGATGYAQIWLADPEAVEPLVTTRQRGGATGYHAIMLARSSSGLRSLSDMEGRTLGFSGRGSLSGYLAPLAAFEAQGLSPDSFFAATVFSGGHEKNLAALAEGRIDAAVTWAVIPPGDGGFEEGYARSPMRRMIAEGRLDMTQLREIWRSPRIPNGPVVVRKNLPPWTRAAIAGALGRLSVDDPACMRRALGAEVESFEPVNHQSYRLVVEALRRE